MRVVVARPLAAAIAAIVFHVGVRLNLRDLGVGIAIGTLADPFAAAVVAALLAALPAIGAPLALRKLIAARVVFTP